VRPARPQHVIPNPQEEAWLDKISFGEAENHDVLRTSCDAAAPLARSLLARGAIPEVRIRYFCDPKLNIGGHGKSRKQVFEANGTSGEAILRDGNFLKYLKYFLFGPDLPDPTINEFIKIVEDDLGSSGEVREQLRRFVRAETRRLPSQRAQDFAEEFFKLALESGLDLSLAVSIRDAARTTK
jgi:hypothetical protein